ncbi:hypothetical protein [Pseudomonas sp. Teo4]|uniref:hypothetical protein n=1 Tax=Pseudomonas sp. Teo4 TaxID=3064528 RepID=UPI002ABAC1DD|nr:hypothetical protein [Pseudomonas sp. Teo4]MDZ3991510.1 hypothetical protein [Pseudomonas sp. Teo4]
MAHSYPHSGNRHVQGDVRLLVRCGAMHGYLRRSSGPGRITLQRLPACVAAKQNGFWQIVS